MNLELTVRKRSSFRTDCFRNTFATTDDEVLVGSTKATPYDIITLLLSHKSLNDIFSVEVDQVDFALGHIDEHMSRVSADVDACHLAPHRDAIFFPLALEIIYDNLALTGNDSHPLAVGRNGNILYTVIHLPIANKMAIDAPETKSVTSM